MTGATHYGSMKRIAAPERGRELDFVDWVSSLEDWEPDDGPMADLQFELFGKLWEWHVNGVIPDVWAATAVPVPIARSTCHSNTTCTFS